MRNENIAIIGLGYVGLPLAVAFAKKHNVFGIDINKSRIKHLNQNLDQNNEVKAQELKKVLGKSLFITSSIKEAKNCNVFIITVPTPITFDNKPDLSSLINATKSVAKVLKKGDTVVYESTVYPGVTEDICSPIIENQSSLKLNKDFFLGYSPERINPGDKVHTITKITKIVSGSTRETLDNLDRLYGSIIDADIHKAPSIKTAEAAKVIENTQRDLNIAFINELVMIFDKLEINTTEVLEAANTKWNFLNFSPGLVGGHCIGVDPYYLSYVSKLNNYTPKLIDQSRYINNQFPNYIVNKTLKIKNITKTNTENLRFLCLGYTFKENCPDVRNTKVLDLLLELNNLGIKVDLYDPVAVFENNNLPKNVSLINKTSRLVKYDIVYLAVSHEVFRAINIPELLKKDGILFDIKSFYKNLKSESFYNSL